MKRTGRLGFRVLAAPPRLDGNRIERLAKIASPNLADAMGRFNFMDPAIQARTGKSLCGPAVTANLRPGDNLMVHKALDVATAGDVIVVNTNGNTTTAVFGELMCHTAVAKKLGGMVVDGAIRDVEAIRRLGLAAFSRSVSPGSCDKDGPGEVNVPIACGGVVVAPGDIVVGDEDGVVVVPRDAVDEVLEEVTALMERERKRIEEIGRGVLIRKEIDETLRDKGVIP